MTDQQLKEMEAEHDRVVAEVTAMKKTFADKRAEIGKLSARCQFLQAECKVAAEPLKVRTDHMTFLASQISQERHRRIEESAAKAKAEAEAEAARKAAEEAAKVTEQPATEQPTE